MTLVMDAETRQPGELFQHQQNAWQSQRHHVADESGFYRDLWKGLSPPEDLRDLPYLPLTSKPQLRNSQRQYPPFGDYLASSRADVIRLHRTSGTTGQAMNLALSGQDCKIMETVGGRCHRTAGLTAEHTVAHCLNYQMWMGGVTDHLTLEATGATVVPFGVGASERLIETIREVGINAISCTPSYPAVLKQVMEQRFSHLRPRDLGLQLGLFGGEPGLDDTSLRRRIEETWGMTPRNANYGVSDVFSNFAAQCAEDTRLHFLAADVLYPELIDPASLAPVPLLSGEQGELVLTHLMRECQPLVRFRTGDIIAVEDCAPCRCHRTGFRFRVIGRSDDMVVVRGINIFPTMVAAVVNGFEELSGDYRIPLDLPPPYDMLPVQVEIRKGRKEIEGLAESIERAIKSQLGARARVTLVAAGTFPLTEGKTSRVIRRVS